MKETITKRQEKRYSKDTWNGTTKFDGHERNWSVVFTPDARSSIDFKQTSVYKQDAKDEIDLLSKVRAKDMFAGVDKTYLDELAKNLKYKFTLRPYQKEMVLTMLNTFNGNGVFGDQVGLGKTIAALVTAHVMYKEGAINDALIVVPAKMVDNWTREIKEKFGDNVFDLQTDSSDTFTTVVDKIKENRGPSNSRGARLRLYILTAEKFKPESVGMSKDIQNVCNEFEKDWDEKGAEYFTKTIAGMNIDGVSNNIRSMLFESGWHFGRADWQAWKNGEGQMRNTHLLFMTRAKYTTLLKSIEDKIKKISQETRQFEWKKTERANLEEFYIQLEKELQQAEEKLEEDKQRTVYASLIDDKSRLIDLLIVDEIHGWSRKESQHSIEDAIHYIAGINRKFSVFLSATPLRTKLTDAKDLLYMLKTIGKENAEEYFYNVICRIPEDKREFPLVYMAQDGEDSKQARANLFGFLTHHFTMNRLTDTQVQTSLQGKTSFGHILGNTYDRTYVNADTTFQKWVNDNEASIKEEIVVGRKQRRLDTSKDIQWETWKKGALEESSTASHIRAAVYTVALREKKFEYVDFSACERYGYAVVPNPDETDYDKKVVDVIIALSGRARPTELKTGYALRWTDNALKNATKGALKNATKSELEDAINAIIEDLQGRVEASPMVLYIPRKTTSGVMVRETIKDMLEKNSKREIRIKEEEIKREITEEPYNAIALVDGGFQAGVNLQQYKVMIFASMDDADGTLISPVDAEQWIGRIHRGGQQDNVRIIMVLHTEKKRYNDSEFLQWYFDILQDEAGFNLFSATSNVALLQPFVAEYIEFALQLTPTKRGGTFGNLMLQAYKNPKLKVALKEAIQVIAQRLQEK